MSFLSFFQSLISEGTIPYGNYVFLANNNGQSSGEYGEIRSNDFCTECIAINLITNPPTEGASLNISGVCLDSYQHKFVLTFIDGKWHIDLMWKSKNKLV